MKKKLLIFSLLLIFLLAYVSKALAIPINYENFSIEPRLLKSGINNEVTITVADFVYNDETVQELEVTIGDTVFPNKLSNVQGEQTYTLPIQNNTGSLEVKFNDQLVSTLHVIDPANTDNLVSVQFTDINGNVLDDLKIYCDGQELTNNDIYLNPSGILDIFLSNADHVISFPKSDADNNLYFVQQQIAQQPENNEEIFLDIKAVNLNKVNFIPYTEPISQQMNFFLNEQEYLPIDLQVERDFYFSTGQYNVEMKTNDFNYFLDYEDILTIDENNTLDLNEMIGKINFNFPTIPPGTVIGKYVIYKDNVFTADKTIYLKQGLQNFDSIFILYKIDGIKYKVVLENYAVDLQKELLLNLNLTLQDLIIETEQAGDYHIFTPKILTTDGNKVSLEKNIAGDYQDQILVEIFAENGNLLSANYGFLQVNTVDLRGNYTVKATLEANPLYGEKTTEIPLILETVPSNQIVTSSPPESATDVPVDTQITIEFAENIQLGNSEVNLTENSVTGQKIPIETLVEENLLIIKAVSFLKHDTEYYVYLPAGSVLDQTGANLVEQDCSFSFLTEKLPVEVTAVNALSSTILQVIFDHEYVPELTNKDFELNQNNESISIGECIKNAGNTEAILVLAEPLKEFEQFNVNGISGSYDPQAWMKGLLFTDQSVFNLYGIKNWIVNKGIVVQGSDKFELFIQPVEEIFIIFN